ncbi:MAG TPA: hypothetical protein PK122_05970 [Candidatus Paceibacterota bacterium]|nr:hypothetical protein [Candidatus Paceibacterota bacterium]
MSVISQIRKTFKVSFEKEWYNTYWAFDVHGTILKPTYDLNEDHMEFYPYAKEALQKISKRSDIIMILWTCSYPHEIQKYIEFFKNHGIHFHHINENPRISSNMGNFGYYEQKFYFNVLFEDKAGFQAESEWKEVYTLMKKYETDKYFPNSKWSTKY